MSNTARTPKDFRKHYGFHNRATKMHLLRKSDKCGICGEPIKNLKESSIDHIVPLSKGGQDIPSNMQVAHISCNQAKGNKNA